MSEKLKAIIYGVCAGLVVALAIRWAFAPMDALRDPQSWVGLRVTMLFFGSIAGGCAIGARLE